MLDPLARSLGRADAVDLFGRGGFLVLEASVRWIALARALAVTPNAA